MFFNYKINIILKYLSDELLSVPSIQFKIEILVNSALSI